MSEKAYINPQVFRWARKSAKISDTTAASKVSISVEKLIDWESGNSQPTIKQAQTLAKLYKRPFSIFFLPEVPSDFQILKDFRIKDSVELGTASIFIIREIQQKQAWISELNKENNEPKRSFVGKYSYTDNSKIVATDILNTLDINPINYVFDNPIKEWISKSEQNGIFISRTSFIHSRMKLYSNEIQGFAIADEFAPFIFVNSDDWDSPQLFTLVHELAHIWISETGISNTIGYDFDNKDKFHPIELFCNEVAANALMPSEYMLSLDKDIFNYPNEVFKISKKLGVSSFAFIIRALNTNLINYTAYNSLKLEASNEFNMFLKNEENRKAKLKENTEKKRGPDYYLLLLNRNSRLFTHTVLDAFRGGFIEPTTASSLLSVQTNKFPKLEAQLYK